MDPGRELPGISYLKMVWVQQFRDCKPAGLDCKEFYKRKVRFVMLRNSFDALAMQSMKYSVHEQVHM